MTVGKKKENFKQIQILINKTIQYITRLKKMIENNSSWEGAFYQSEWIKINPSSVLFIYVYCC